MLPFLLFLIIYDGYSQTIDCSGSCNCPSSGTNTCTLRCIGTDKCKDGTLTCRSNTPCIIICEGNNACSGNSKIDASGATDVSITCTGTDTCKGNTIIDCGTGDCEVTCSSSTSCENADINAPNADSFICSGSCSPASAPAPFTAPPTPKPTTKSPTNKPTTKSPTIKPTNNPLKIPTNNPIVIPTSNPIKNPTTYPTKNPTKIPTKNPTVLPSKYPTQNPSNTILPTKIPSKNPTVSPTDILVTVPSTNPSQSPTVTQQHKEVEEGTNSPVESDELDVDAQAVSNNNNHLESWVYIIMTCTGIFCCLITLLVLFKCGVFKRKKNKFEHKVAGMNMYDQGYGNEHGHGHGQELDKQSNEYYEPQVIGQVKSVPLTFEGEFNSTYNSNLKNALAIISGNSPMKNMIVPSDEEISSDSNDYITTGGSMNNNELNNEVQMVNKSGKGYALEGMDVNTGDMELLDEIDKIADTLGDGDYTIRCENNDEIDDISNINDENSLDVEDKQITIGISDNDDDGDYDVDADDIIEEIMTPQGGNYVVQDVSDDSEEAYITIQ